MAIDASGKLFAFHRAETPIVELDRDGKILKTWGDELVAWPHGIRVDRFGNLWITDGQARNGINDGNIYVGETISGTTLTGPPRAIL